MICCWIAADCGFLFTFPTAWVTVAKLTLKLFADYSTYWWVFQSAGILHREDAGFVMMSEITNGTPKSGLQFWRVKLLSCHCLPPAIRQHLYQSWQIKASVLYLKLWFRENAALVSNAWWNGISLRIHEYLHFAGFYFFGVFCCFSSMPYNCSAWFLVPFSVPVCSLRWQAELE